MKNIRILLTSVLSCCLLLFFSPAANAHDRLVGSDPSELKVLTESPKELKLQFSNPIQNIGAQARLVNLESEDKIGKELPVTLNQETVIMPVSQPLPDGVYGLVWRVVSSDGHPISGQIRFAIGSDKAALTNRLNTAISKQENKNTQPQQAANTPQQSTQPAGNMTAIFLIGFAVLVLILAGLSMLIIKRKRNY